MMKLSKFFDQVTKKSFKYKIKRLINNNELEIIYKGKTYNISYMVMGIYSVNDESYTWMPEMTKHISNLKEIIKTKTYWFSDLLIKNFNIITDYIFDKTVLIEKKYMNIIPYFFKLFLKIFNLIIEYQPDVNKYRYLLLKVDNTPLYIKENITDKDIYKAFYNLGIWMSVYEVSKSLKYKNIKDSPKKISRSSGKKISRSSGKKNSRSSGKKNSRSSGKKISRSSGKKISRTSKKIKK